MRTYPVRENMIGSARPFGTNKQTNKHPVTLSIKCFRSFSVPCEWRHHNRSYGSQGPWNCTRVWSHLHQTVRSINGIFEDFNSIKCHFKLPFMLLELETGYWVYLLLSFSREEAVYFLHAFFKGETFLNSVQSVIWSIRNVDILFVI